MWPFQKKPKYTPTTVTTAQDFPSGLAVRTEDAVYFIRGKVKFKIYSDRVLESWSFSPVNGTNESLKRFKRAGTLGFRDATIIQNIADAKMYLISDNKKRHITSPDVFVKFGLDKTKVLEVSQAEANLHEDGEVLL